MLLKQCIQIYANAHELQIKIYLNKYICEGLGGDAGIFVPVWFAVGYKKLYLRNDNISHVNTNNQYRKISP